MAKKKLILFALFVAFLIIASFSAVRFYSIFSDIQRGKIPKYEVGEHRNSAACIQCHKEIYDVWLENSAHARATTSPSFHDFKRKFLNV